MSAKELIKTYDILKKPAIKKPIYLTTEPLPIVEKHSIRTEQEEELYMKLKTSGQLILISGDGGTGKTYMARKLFYRLQKDYKYLAWVKYNSDMKSSLLTAFGDCQIKDRNSQFSSILKTLTRNIEKTILFIDDVSENAFNDDVLSRITGLGITILITSRCKSIPPYETHEISKLTEEECTELFYSYNCNEKNQKYKEIVNKVIALLDCNVMSIIMFACTVNSFTDLERCYNALVKNESTNLSIRMQDFIKNLLNISDINQDERKIIQCFALIPSGEITIEIMQWFNLQQKSLCNLIQKGWIVENKKKNTYIMHRFIREYLFKNDEFNEIFEQFLQFANEKWVSVESFKDCNISYKIESIEHALKLANDNEPYYIEICCWLGDNYYKMKKFDKALSFYDKALQVELNKAHIDITVVIKIYYKVGSVYKDKGMYANALENYKVMESYFDKSYDIDQNELVEYKKSVGEIYQDLGEYFKALTYYEEALKIQKQKIDNKKIDIAQTLNDIGTVYHDLADYQKALNYYSEAFKIWKENGNASDRIVSYNNIGEIYHELGNYESALQQHMEALKIIKMELDNNDVDLSDSYNNIGNIYLDMGQYKKSYKYQIRALKIQRKIFGHYHPNVAASYNNLSAALLRLNKIKKAKEYAEKSINIRERVLGCNHISTAISYNSLAKTLAENKEYNDALKYHKKALSIQQSSLPENHPYVAQTYLYLSNVYFVLNEEELSLEYGLKSCYINQKKFGLNHIYTKTKIKTLKKYFEAYRSNENFNNWYDEQIYSLENSNQ